jgi:hypothetical protein
MNISNVTYTNSTVVDPESLTSTFYRSSLVLFIFGMGFFLPLMFCIYSMFVARRRRLTQIQGLINGRVRLMTLLLNGGGQTRGLTPLERSLLPVVHYSSTFTPPLEATSGSAVGVKPIPSDSTAVSQAEPSPGVGDGQTSCVICLVDYLVGDSVVILTCGHRFHEECGYKWLEESTKCPLCKLDIAAALKETASALLAEMPESDIAAATGASSGGGGGGSGGGDGVGGNRGMASNSSANRLPGAPLPTLAVRTVPTP